MFFSNWTRNELIYWLSYEPQHPADGLSDFDLLKDEIKVGDVLLVEGQCQVSRIIKTFTQRLWSMAKRCHRLTWRWHLPLIRYLTR